MTQTIEPAIAARNEALAAVEGASDVVVLHELRRALRVVAERMPSFTTDDLTDEAKLTPREPRVIGAVMIWAQSESICNPTGRYVKSRRTECHARPKMVWQSLIYKGNE